MKQLNWNNFESKFHGYQEKAFEQMAYFLFCSMFNQPNGIRALKNHPGIETDPIKVGDNYIGFQAKYTSHKISATSKKTEIIRSLKIAKKNESQLDEVFIFLNDSIGSSSKKNIKESKFIRDIETEGLKLNLKIKWQFPSQLQIQLSNPKNIAIANEFFPEFIEKELFFSDKEDHIDISRTAMIQTEIAKIKYKFSYDWKENLVLLNQISAFMDFRNEIIAKDIFIFLNDRVSILVPSDLQDDFASSIFTLILTYFPSSQGKIDEELRIENGKHCVGIGFNIIYDAFIYSNDFKIAQWGLNIWKYIYRESKRNDFKELTSLILDEYADIEKTLKKLHLDDAIEFLQIFKNDLKTYSLSFPPLPKHLYKLILK